jgi:hypothetical protein
LKRIPISEVRRLPAVLRQFMVRRGSDYKANRWINNVV